MNTLQEKFFKAILGRTYIKAAESCAEISKLDAIAFAEWVDINCVRCSQTEFTCRLDNYTTFITTENLYSLYQTQQNG